MNSEELESSLRAEFEQHLKGIRSEMKQQLAAFQERIESEFTKHKSQINEAFGDFSARIDSPGAMDSVLQESVVEHLRLARDNGAQLAASAAAEAEKLGLDNSGSSSGYDLIRNAVAAISTQTSQASILKTLIDHAGHFAPRGAFFIIKNENFIGWQVFGSHSITDENSARAISFSVDADSLPGVAVRALSTQQGSFGLHSDDSKFLKTLEFGQPKQMVAIPLIARGRGVAVLYADAGEDTAPLNIGALETLVRIAAITVELQAAAQTIRTQGDSNITKEQGGYTAANTVKTFPVNEPTPATQEAYELNGSSNSVSEEFYPSADDEITEPSPASDEVYVQQDEVIAVEAEVTLDDEAYLMTEPVEEVVYAVEEISVDTGDSSRNGFEFVAEDPVIERNDAAIQVGYDDGFQTPTNGSNKPELEPAVASTNGTRSRREKSLDLPIEVADSERDDHTKARKFARLLVSEIKLYNEKQVKEGREANDLYDRLREAVDRSREMYNKRVMEPVAEKFDYFHYELVNSLAEGDEARMGRNYPGGHR